MAFVPTPSIVPWRMRSARSARSTSSVQMTAPRTQQLPRPATLDKAGLPTQSISTRQGALDEFEQFFNTMPGSWNSQRTYHYLTRDPPREDSRTTFDVAVLDDAAIADVLSCNATSSLPDLQRGATLGFRVEFLTKMQMQEELVRAGTNLAFVPERVFDGGVISGSYYRDLGYQEAAPIKAAFVFDCGKMELTMTTYYTRVVSVDQISLISPTLRLRKIVNYRRVADGEVMDDALLVGFGVERKGEAERLVS